ncbi:hypothetical protein NEUTE1DRAFT_131048 [Neurospora tetrasperma FGSC 2508]|uniref:G-protein coupled receptors family 2 profile 2 domain-containing protein n=1 Tax=Neurospora tetrasperma (strain FGSC 2508 / ATCC MYA-4615 / P0657) TaxID=510951 RepID=F8MT97_NEUT8|nr:uncharacterized protein NEUTE1DRAFT_131048 [Neurospora tetrasperma FGSC 2508]EGO55229.1 hypothetical protein NEUTE1DRAFT_131048 [Neurospora tetrasperma FGSC 2508]EGZ69553.1 hypothetical protein NEUTE2DRAFT_116198 [Neurospora tetrasperma FGSC 2509]
MIITPEDTESIVVIERVCSALSLLGGLFVITSFSVSDAFRQRAINRMVFFATFGNILTNVATLMTTAFTDDINSFGCQFQGFLVQVFMQGDAFWALAMAINVYLTFYHQFDGRALRKMEIPYFLFCYGVPFISGFTFIFIRQHGERPYGNAILWCWLSKKWEVYRIATFYVPVWLCITVATTIYIRAGRDIYKKHRSMSKLGSSSNGGTLVDMFAPAYNYKTTKVTQTTEIISPPSTSNGYAANRDVIFPHTPIPLADDAKVPASCSVTVTISSDNHNHSSNKRSSQPQTDITTNRPHSGGITGTITTTTSTIDNDDNNNNERTIVHISAGNGSGTAANMQARAQRRLVHEAHNAVWSYTKCAILFFAVLLITWIPSSGNRVYTMINDGEVSKPLFFASAFVLPLQGFWNAIIYVVTSWAACKELGAEVAEVFDVVKYRCMGCCVGGSRGNKKRDDDDDGIILESTRMSARRGDSNRRRSGGGGAAGSSSWAATMARAKAQEMEIDTTSMEDLTGNGARMERVSPV